MRIECEIARDGLVVHLLGELIESGCAERFRDFVRDALAIPRRFLLVDFSEASLPDSRFVGRIIELYHDCHGRGIGVYLFCGSNEDALDLFRVASLDQYLPIVEGVDAVHWALNSKG